MSTEARSHKQHMRMWSILNRITYKDWHLHVGRDSKRNFAPYLQWEFIAPCAKTGTPAKQRSRKWYLSEYMTESELVQTAFKAALTAEEHECREAFRYAGYRVFNPHVSVTALMTVCHREDVRE